MNENPKVLCGAKVKGGPNKGGRCQRTPCAGSARCYVHGGAKGSGRPVKHGRSSKYARIFGEGYSQAARDPELLRSEPELALFDTFLGERAELLGAGFSEEWLAEVHSALQALRDAMFVAKNVTETRTAFERLERVVQVGGERVRCWEELLAKAKERSELASKAQAALARQDATMTESKMVVMFGKMLDVLTDVAGAEVARKVTDRFERDVFGLRQPGAGSVGTGEAGAAGTHGVN